MTRAEDKGIRPAPGSIGERVPAVRMSADAGDFSGRDPETELIYHVIGLKQLGTAPWRSLNALALTPSSFFDPVFLRAVSGFGGAKDVRLMVVQDPDDDTLKIVWPFFTKSLVAIPPLTAAATFTNHYAPASIPIIAPQEANKAIVTALRGFAELAPVLTIPNLPLDCEAAKALFKVLANWPHSHTVTGQSTRPVLKGGKIFSEYAATHWSRGRRNKIRRFTRRLAEMGSIAFRSAGAGNLWEDAAEAFLDLEQSGWKGRAGTAMAANQNARRVIDEIVSRLVPAGLAEIHALILDDRPIAMLILLRLRGHVMAWKTAYDEAYAKYSPGHVLFAEVTQKLIARGDKLADSCATDAESVADAYWAERMPVGMLHIGLRSGTAGYLGLKLSATRAAALDVARDTHRVLRRRR